MSQTMKNSGTVIDTSPWILAWQASRSPRDSASGPKTIFSSGRGLESAREPDWTWIRQLPQEQCPPQKWSMSTPMEMAAANTVVSRGTLFIVVPICRLGDVSGPASLRSLRIFWARETPFRSIRRNFSDFPMPCSIPKMRQSGIRGLWKPPFLEEVCLTPAIALQSLLFRKIPIANYPLRSKSN